MNEKIKSLIKPLFSLKFRTRMNSPITGKPMTGIFFFVEGTFDWDLWLEKKIKEVKEKL